MISELRRAARLLAGDPSTTLIAVTTLALAVGSATAVMGVVNAVLLAPLPFVEVERLHHLRAVNPEVAAVQDGISYPDLLDFEAAAAGFVELAGFYPYAAVLTGEDVPRQLAVGYTSLNFFSMLGVEPVVGRPYTAQPSGGIAPAETVLDPAGVAVISEALWQRVFGGDPGIVGRAVVVDGELRRILGVMPDTIGLPAPDTDMWLPWGLPQQRRNDRFLGVVARRAPDVTATVAVGELAATAAGLAERHPDTNDGWTVAAAPLRDVLLGEITRPMWILSAAVFLVLAVAAANVASLLLARNWRRTREIAVQRALGATRGRITRALLLESLILALLATLAGVGVGRLLARLVPLLAADLPLRGPTLDFGVLSAASAMALLVGLIAGLTPALQAARQDPLAGLKDGGRAGTGRDQLRLRGGLVAIEAALVTILLVGAALLLDSYVRLTRVAPGFDTNGVVVARIELEPSAAASAAARVGFFDTLLSELRARPEVAAAGATTVLPMASSGTDFNRPYWREGETNPGGTAAEADIRMSAPGFFRALGIPLLAGRDFDAADHADNENFRAGARIAIVNRSLAELNWPEQDAVGKRIVLDYPRQIYTYEIVGVVGDARYYGPRSEPRPEIYIPYAQNPYPGMSVVVRVLDDARGFATALPDLVADLNPAQPVSEVMLADDLLAGSVARDRLITTLLAVFGALALVVAAVGVYGLVASSVAARTRELGIRLAVGARGSDLVRQVLREVLVVAGTGVAAGMLVSLVALDALGELLYQTDPADPLILAAVAAFLLAVVALAGLVPAWSTTRIDPLIAIRHE